MKPVVTIYQRDGCHLCEIAAEHLVELQREHGFEICAVDIEASDQLHAAYLERIPVIAVNGDELYDFEIDIEDLKSRLLRLNGQ